MSCHCPVSLVTQKVRPQWGRRQQGKSSETEVAARSVVAPEDSSKQRAEGLRGPLGACQWAEEVRRRKGDADLELDH